METAESLKREGGGKMERTGERLSILFSIVVAPIYIATKKCRRVTVSPYPLQNLLVDFLVIAILNSVR